MDFSTLAEGLNITEEEYGFIESFVLNPFTSIPDSQDLLLINSNKEPGLKEAKHIYKELLKGQIWILFISSVKLYFQIYGYRRTFDEWAAAAGRQSISFQPGFINQGL